MLQDQLNVYEEMKEHKSILVKHEDRIRSLEVKEAVLGAKLDLTNKLLFGILAISGTAMVTFIFEILKK